MIEKLLHTLGFSADEARLYLALWQSGPTAVGRIAQRLGMPRSSLYGLLDRLVQKGIVSWEDTGGGVRRYHAEPPKALEAIFQRRRQELEDAQKDFQRLLPQLSKQSRGDFSAPRMTVYQGKAQLKNILSDIFLYQDIETYSLWPIKLMMDVLGADYFRHHNITRIQKRIHVKAIWPAASTVDAAKHPYLGGGSGFLREIRIAPPEMDFTMGYWIYGDQVAVLSSVKECFGFVLESREFANMLRVQHMAVWALSKPFETPPKAVAGFLAQHGSKSGGAKKPPSKPKAG